MPEPGLFRLAAGEVHVWCARLDLADDALARCYATLAVDERQRSARLRFARDRRRFVAAHGVLRQLLGRYLGTSAERVAYIRSAFGKPALAPECAGRIRFNLSHSAGFALVAIAADAELGVDLEHLREASDYPEIARQFFSAAEIEYLRALPPHRYAQAFIACWTRKEAYLKARGEGLAGGMGECSVLLASERKTGPRDPGEQRDQQLWCFHELRPTPGYIGTLAIEGSGWRLSEREWDACKDE